MRLTAHTDFGLRVLIYLALHPDKAVPAGEVAEHYGISVHHLRKVVQTLAHTGFVLTVRGKGGGIRLARDPAEIRLGEVVVALEPDMHMAECFRAADACAISPACRLKTALADARAAFLDELDRVTLAEVVGSGRALRRLLGLQTPEAASGQSSSG